MSEGSDVGGQGSGFLKLPPHLPHPSFSGWWPPLASLQIGGLTLGLSCQDPPWLGSFPSLSLVQTCRCWPLRTWQQPPLLHAAPAPQLDA